MIYLPYYLFNYNKTVSFTFFSICIPLLALNLELKDYLLNFILFSANFSEFSYFIHKFLLI